MFNFIADNEDENMLQGDIEIPYIEDARADFAPFYKSTKSITEVEKLVRTNFSKLGAVVKMFQSGKFDDNGKTRFGYVITFIWHGAKGQVLVAGLPMRSHTKTKETQVRVQALMNVAQWLQTLVTQQVFSPNSHPLIPYMLASDGKTIMQHILESKAIPQLSATVVDTELIEG